MDRPYHLGEPVMDLLVPTDGRGIGVLVAHPWWGLNATIRGYGEALRREGFVVGLPDLFAGDVTLDIATAEQLIRKHWEATTGRLAAAIDELASHPAVTGPGIGAVGFSFGGYHLLEALGDKRLPLTRLVTYYATHPLPAHHVPILAHLATDDEHESAEDMAAMNAALVQAGLPNASFTYPGTKHWFAEADRPEYDADAARLAFSRTAAFLRG
jgi:carboxymethylenebutenolidase